jgi:hypothetical protein
VRRKFGWWREVPRDGWINSALSVVVGRGETP